MCSNCLYGILDLINVLPIGQIKRFTPDQWDLSTKKFKLKRTKPLSKFSTNISQIVAHVKDFIESGGPEKAHYHILSMVETTSFHEQWILKMLYHIEFCIYLYFISVPSNTLSCVASTPIMKHVFNSPPSSITEYDYMYLILPHESRKVDGRILCKVSSSNKIIGICQIEAAKSTTNCSKILTDHAKLTVESKCILDDTIMKPNFTPMSAFYGIQNVQIAGIQADVSSLKLINGCFYIHLPDFNLSLKPDVLQFASIISTWIRRLIIFKDGCYMTGVVTSSATTNASLELYTALVHVENVSEEYE
ncbi:hypothetical protein K501DRAFT_274270 [Backusella circina FSU 941]|nr:hypothetical protein K501DRAFT_274270 [Backusella circina FSU 941]